MIKAIYLSLEDKMNEFSKKIEQANDLEETACIYEEIAQVCREYHKEIEALNE